MKFPSLSFFFIHLGMLFCTCSCAPYLSIQTQYLSREHLASFHVGTPDPKLNEPVIGQRLLIQWSLPAQEIKSEQLILFLKVRYRNHQEKEVSIPIQNKRGTYLYIIENEEYLQTGGILTYFAEIRSEACVLVTWKHPLWTQLIQLKA